MTGAQEVETLAMYIRKFSVNIIAKGSCAMTVPTDVPSPSLSLKVAIIKLSLDPSFGPQVLDPETMMVTVPDS